MTTAGRCDLMSSYKASLKLATPRNSHLHIRPYIGAKIINNPIRWYRKPPNVQKTYVNPSFAKQIATPICPFMYKIPRHFIHLPHSFNKKMKNDKISCWSHIVS